MSSLRLALKLSLENPILDKNDKSLKGKGACRAPTRTTLRPKRSIYPHPSMTSTTFGLSDKELRRRQRLDNKAASDDDDSDDATLRDERKKKTAKKKEGGGGSKHKRCKHKGCANQAVQGGVCRRHGAKVEPCSREGCTNKSRAGGLCQRHGAKRTCCSHEGCTNNVHTGGVCARHGAKRKQCSHEGCTKYSQTGGLCKRHGAVVTVKRCSHEGCGNKSVQGGVCIRHGALVKRCSHEGCTKQSQNGGVCVRHGALVKRCSHEGCTNIHQSGGFCRRHGAVERQKRCHHKGCENLSHTGELCKRHAMMQAKRHAMMQAQQRSQPTKENRIRLKWEERVAQLRAFRAKNGHVDVPRTYTKDPSLGSFVHNQRSAYERMKKGKGPSMDRLKVQQLSELGFKWVLKQRNKPAFVESDDEDSDVDRKPVAKAPKPKSLAWEVGLQRLRAFQLSNGNSAITYTRIYAADQPLGTFVRNIRRSYKRMQQGQYHLNKLLNDHRIAELNSMGFKFQVRQRKPWEQRFKELKKHVKRHGNCEVPEDTPLGVWIMNQRSLFKPMFARKMNSISQQRIDSLNSIGFDWRIDTRYAQRSAVCQKHHCSRKPPVAVAAQGEVELLPQPAKEHKVTTAGAIAGRGVGTEVYNQHFDDDEINAWIWKSSRTSR